jgi:hypothetical protein
MTRDLTPWQEQAECLDRDPDIWFPDSELESAYTQARAICTTCPVIEQCRKDAMTKEAGQGITSRFGMRGGLTPAERLTLDRGPKRHPERMRQDTVRELAAAGVPREEIAARVQVHPDSVSRILRAPVPERDRIARCGTRAAIERHTRWGEPIDAACQEARDRWNEQRRRTYAAVERARIDTAAKEREAARDAVRRDDALARADAALGDWRARLDADLCRVGGAS